MIVNDVDVAPRHNLWTSFWRTVCPPWLNRAHSVADPATFLASNSVLGTLFSPEDSLFIQLLKQYMFMSLYY